MNPSLFKGRIFFLDLTLLMKTSLTNKYYVPGLISAILIPLVFWYYGNRKLQEPLPNVMDLGLPAKYDPNIPLNKQITLEAYRDWNYKKIEVVANTAKENSKSYVSEIRNLQERNEKNTGIEFILDDENSYDDFVAILNDLAIANHDIYGLDLDKTGHIFALVNYKDPNKKIEPDYLRNDVVLMGHGSFISGEKQNPNTFETIKKFLQNLPENTYFIILGFLFFLNISMLNIKKFL